jgi:flavin reductase (DIM6/NTAB) family NADH-FMN oxidoreductase RutF
MATRGLRPDVFRTVMGHFPTGVSVITAERGPGEVHGMTANSFTSVSLDPLLVLVCVAEDARLLPFLKRQRRFGASFLKENQQALSEHFAKGEQTPEAEARLGIRFRWTASGIPQLEDALAHLGCNVVAEYISGDHTIFIGEVESMDVAAGEPLLFHRGRYRRLQP